MELRIENLTKHYGGHCALDEVTICLHPGVYGLLGPNGAGKSTLMNLLTDTVRRESGAIYYNGKEILELGRTYRKAVGYMPQQQGYYEEFTVIRFLYYMAALKGLRRAEAKGEIRRLLEVVGLPDCLHKKMGSLSGGMRQRILLVQALLGEPRLLLLDEPLSNLDAKLRVDMRSELKRLHHDTGSTIIYVTHDQVEALTMSTKIALFREGELVQVDKPLELYDNPCDLYTADFIGNPSINFVEASGTAGASGLSVDGVMGRLEFSREDMTPEAPASGDLKLVLGIRPEQITISREKTDAAQVEARVYAGMPAGSETLVSVRVGEKLITVKELGSTHYAGDETVYLSYPPKKVNVFDASTKRLIKYSR